MAVSIASWRALCIFLALVVFLQFYLLFSDSRVAPSRASTQPPRVIAAPERPDSRQWVFETERDALNPALTAEQCDAAFPDLFAEVERSVKYWKDRKHVITADDVSIDWRRDGAMRVLVHDNQVRVLQAKNTWQPGGYYKRALPLLSQLNRALLGASAAGVVMPTVEFSVTVDDMSLVPGGQDDTHTVWAFTRNRHDRAHDKEWIVPDFNFWANRGDSFYDMQLRAASHHMPFSEKIPQAVWRGVRWTNEHVRGNLLDKTADKQWADIKEMEWKTKTDFMRMDDFCRYAFVVHTEGRSWSGRLKYILNCAGSVPVIHDLDWIAHSYNLLIPDGPHQNHLRVKRDFSDLETKIEHLLAHPDEAQRIADNAAKTFRERYTTLAAETCYWRRLLQGWSEVAFAPEPYETQVVTVGGQEAKQRVLRGKSYEGIALENEEWMLKWAESQKEEESQNAGG